MVRRSCGIFAAHFIHSWMPEEERLDFELAGYAKYLVLAGYLASYNDPRYDVDYFSTKIVGKAKKGGGRKFVQLKVNSTSFLGLACVCILHLKWYGVQEDPNLRLLGPRDFPIDRMLAIFSSIAAGKEVSFGKIDTGDHNIYHQVCHPSMEKSIPPILNHMHR